LLPLVNKQNPRQRGLRERERDRERGNEKERERTEGRRRREGLREMEIKKKTLRRYILLKQKNVCFSFSFSLHLEQNRVLLVLQY
jgi:hypothetical protein